MKMRRLITSLLLICTVSYGAVTETHFYNRNAGSNLYPLTQGVEYD